MVFDGLTDLKLLFEPVQKNSYHFHPTNLINLYSRAQIDKEDYFNRIILAIFDDSIIDLSL